jgi:hypothetical protein
MSTGHIDTKQEKIIQKENPKLFFLALCRYEGIDNLVPVDIIMK